MNYFALIARKNLRGGKQIQLQELSQNTHKLTHITLKVQEQLNFGGSRCGLNLKWVEFFRLNTFHVAFMDLSSNTE